MALASVATMVDASSEDEIRGVCVELGAFPSVAGLSVVRVQGGITNQLFCVRGGDVAVLVRCYGGEGVIDRRVETLTFAALCGHLGRPRLLGTFGNGRLEEFLEGHSTLALDGMRSHSEEIARRLAHFHGFRVPPALREHHASCGLWRTLRSWHATAFGLDGALAAFCAADPACGGVLARHASIFDGPFLLKCLEALEGRAPPADGPAVVFCHNDLLSGNLMVDDATGEVRVIDLEYGGLNYAAFDIANHFMEWGGGTGQPETSLGVPDDARYPTAAERRAWIDAYLRAAPESLGPASRLLKDVDFFCVVDHFYWGLWACCQTHAEGCFDFPYLVYAKSRLRAGLAGLFPDDETYAASPAFGLDVPGLGATPKTPTGARALYDDWARTYDAALRSWGYCAPEMCAALLEAARPQGGGALFDCGCGTGLAVAALRRGTYADVLGADISQASLDLCVATGLYNKALNLDLARPLPLDAKSFDAVLCVGVLSYVADFALLFAEWIRVAKAGAVVVFTHRAALWDGGDGAQAAARALEEAGAWRRDFCSDPRPYMPNNPDPAERAKTIVCCRFLVLAA